MQLRVINRQPTTRATRRGHQSILRLSLVQVALGLVFLAFPLSLHAQSEPGPATTITVLVYNYVRVSPGMLAAAEREANKILGAAGAWATWVDCLERPVAPDSKELCSKGWTAQTPGLRLIPGTNKFRGAEYGYTAIPVLATIYYEKIARRAHRDNADPDLPVLLGCVMAHELGHLLLGDPGHSATGIMQPQWGRLQIRQALTGNLLFTRQQGDRIQAQARMLASLPPIPTGAAFPPPTP